MDAPGGKKILIIDTDTPEARGLLAFLEKNGYHAQMVTNYQQSFTAMQNWKPDLVILNILIRSFNPLDFLTDLKKNPFTEAQRIVIFSQTSKAGIVTGPAPKVRATTVSRTKPRLAACIFSTTRACGIAVAVRVNTGSPWSV